MLRSLLIYLSEAGWAQRLVTGWGPAWKAASRFVAGVTVQDALRVVRELNARGMHATLDRLGEHTSNLDEANASADAIVTVLDEIDKAGVKANISIKLTQIGMGLDEEICRQNLVRILEQAKKHGNFVRIDMEGTPYTDITLSMYQSMLDRDYSPVEFGLVMQSYLHRAEADLRALLDKGTRIRLVKGAYNEPPDRAYMKKSETDANFDLLAKILIDATASVGDNQISDDGRVPPFTAIATHDENRIDFARKHAEKVGLPKRAIEFQMLFGVRRDLQEQLVKEGFPVRVYVPFGTHWYPYFMRRLAERPANIWFFVSNLFQRLTMLALVTGAAHRLGKSFALTLAQLGYDIVLHYHTAHEEAHRTQTEIESLSRRVTLAPADLTDPLQVRGLVSNLQALDVLVNSAAFMPGGNVDSLTLENWDTSLDLNLRAPFLLAQECAKKMTEGGLIVNITDVGAQKAWSRYPSYTVSKAGLESLTKVLARAFAPNIRVNAIAPGFILPSDIVPAEEWARLIGRVPLKRPARIEEITSALEFLLKNGYITGQTIVVDGGYSLV